MSNPVEALVAKLNRLSPEHQLQLAIELLSLGKVEVAHLIVQHVDNVLTAQKLMRAAKGVTRT